MPLEFGMGEGEEEAKEREKESVTGQLVVLVEAAVEAVPIAVAETS